MPVNNGMNDDDLIALKFGFYFHSRTGRRWQIRCNGWDEKNNTIRCDISSIPEKVRREMAELMIVGEWKVYPNDDGSREVISEGEYMDRLIREIDDEKRGKISTYRKR